jgi:hypothetical protein
VGEGIEITTDCQLDPPRDAKLTSLTISLYPWGEELADDLRSKC